MKDALTQQKNATECGYYPLFHYNPTTRKFKVDSRADFDKYYDFITTEERYNGLKKVTKEYKELLSQNKKEAIKRYNDYKDIELRYNQDEE